MPRRKPAKASFNPDAPRRAVVYARVSSKEQEREGFSIDAQTKLLREYAGVEDIAIVADFVDVETAKESGRTRFGEMVAFLKRRPSVRTILVEKTDRLYRNLKDWVTIDELDLDIHFVKEGVVLSRDSRSSEKFMHGIKVLMAKNYIDNLSEETRKGMLEKAEQGIWPTMAPLGYRNVMGPNGKKIIELDPDTAPAIIKLFEWYATGLYSLKEAGARARATGMAYRKSQRPLGISTVHKILRSRIYTGEFEWLGKRYQGTHEPLITPELWERVQGVLDGRHSGKKRGIEKDFIFTGLITCGHCGCSLVGDIKKEKYIYYRCSHYKRKCREPYVREEVLTEQFAAMLAKLRIDEKAFGWVVRALKESLADQRKEHELAVERLEKEQARLRHRLQAIYIDQLDGKIEETIYNVLSGQWRDQERKCARQLELHRDSDLSYMDEGVALLRIAKDAHRLFASEERAEKRHMLTTLLSNCSWKDRTLTAEFRQPFDIVAENVSEAARVRNLKGAEKAQKEIWLPGTDSNHRPTG